MESTVPIMPRNIPGFPGIEVRHEHFTEKDLFSSSADDSGVVLTYERNTITVPMFEIDKEGNAMARSEVRKDPCRIGELSNPKVQKAILDMMINCAKACIGGREKCMTIVTSEIYPCRIGIAMTPEQTQKYVPEA